MQGVYNRARRSLLEGHPTGPRPLPLREFLASYGSHTSLLVPPYHTAQHVAQLRPEHPPPLGTIAAGHGRDLLLVVSELWVVIRQWPWVTPCVTLIPDQWQFERLLQLFPDLSHYLAIGRIQSASEAGVKTVVTAVRRRALPTPDVLAHWVCRRIALPAYYLPFLAQFEQALEDAPVSPPLSRATASRRFVKLGRYTARDWRALARLCVELCAVTSSSTPRVLRRQGARYLRKYLGMSARAAASYLGWEWVLEQALRAGGYVRIAEGRPPVAVPPHGRR